MKNMEAVKGFVASLNNRDAFEIIRFNEHVWNVRSETCVISLLFEQHSDGFNMLFEEPILAPEAKPMAFLLLRFLRGAHDPEAENNSTVFFAGLVNNYFSDLLEGDFLIRKEYERVYDDFYTQIFDALTLQEDDPIRIKVERFDISWLEDIKQSND